MQVYILKEYITNSEGFSESSGEPVGCFDTIDKAEIEMIEQFNLYGIDEFKEQELKSMGDMSQHYYDIEIMEVK